MHPLLMRQLRKFLGGAENAPEQMVEFISAVDETYQQSDADRQLLERSLEMSSQELLETNSFLSHLTSTLDATADGILVVNRVGKVTTYNKRFVELWRIPADWPAAKDFAALLEYSQPQLVDPAKFSDRVKNIYSDPEATGADALDFVDGRKVEVVFSPQKFGGEIIGRVWSFRDITERRRAEESLNEKIKELTEFSDLAVGRELKMIGMENEIDSLLIELGRPPKFSSENRSQENKYKI